jgi:ribosomal protein S18 acetylase RimI-like enzyme
MSDEWTIRPAEPRDLPSLHALWKAFMAEQAQLDARATPSDDASERGRTTLRDAVGSKQAIVLVAEQKGAVVGFVAGHTSAPSPVYAGGVEAYLTELYIAPDARRQGLATQLMERAVAWARERGLTRVRYDVLAANHASRATWKQAGIDPISLTYAVELDSEPSTTRRAPMGFEL